MTIQYRMHKICKMNKINLLYLLLIFASNSVAATVSGNFPASTLSAGNVVSLVNRMYVYTSAVGADSKVTFSNVEAGQYTIQLSHLSGYTLSQPQSVTVSSISDNILLGNIGVQKYIVAGSSYSYLWAQDQTYAGTEATSNIVAPTVVNILGKGYQMSDISYAERLRDMYNITLVDSVQPWDSERAYRLFATLDSIPYIEKSPYRFNTTATPTVWKLTSEYLDRDIKIETIEGVKIVTISSAAFTYAAPFVAQIENKKGLYFSKRLHRAALQFATEDGTDIALIERILQSRFGVTIQIPDYLSLTGELAGRFQPFRPAELLQLINTFEELPEGFHVIPALKYLVRRLDGTINIKFPEAFAIAYGSGYIEFMEKTFSMSNEIDVQRIILHEKGHFIYGSVISSDVRDAWIKLGGWYKESNGNWTTTKTTEFVSAYAHGKNPDEDFAETVAAFITNPDIIKSRSIQKYEFFRDAIMFGNSYISQIRPDLTFQVFNLFPNYNYPGKIKRVQISVNGAPDQDKIVTCEIELQPVGIKDNPAQSISMRVFGPKTKELPIAPYFDWNFSPISSGSNIFKSSYTISKYYRKGFWAPEQIVITDSVNNQRYERAVLYGWKCYIDNPSQDLEIPKYVPNSAKMYVTPRIVDGRQVQILSVDWSVSDDRGLESYSSAVKPPGDGYSMYSWGTSFFGNGIAHTEYIIPEFFPSGVYRSPQFLLKDYGGNIIYPFFTNGGGGAGADGIGVKIDEPSPSINIITPSPDTVPPELDLNRITLFATPTVPDLPNGETQVTINYFVRDNKSGLGTVWFRLRDPQGIEHFYYHYHENFYGTFFNGDPTAWKQYKVTVMLPVGSAPGTWGLSSLNLVDRAMNSKSYSFVETIRFNPYVITPFPEFSLQPISQTSTVAGNSITFSASAAGNPIYQWYFNGSSIYGATNSAYTIASAQPNSVGNYWAIATNSSGSMKSSVASYSIVQTGNNATHVSVGDGYVSGLPLTIKTTINYTGTATALNMSVLLPDGWGFVASSGTVGEHGPKISQMGYLDWSWTNIPASPVTFTYTVMAPPSASGYQEFVAIVGVQNGQSMQFLANPDPIILSKKLLPEQSVHSADYNKDYRISLMELTRVIELFNCRFGLIRTGAYSIKSGTEDGFEPDYTRNIPVILPYYHSADTNKDAKIGLLELTRIIELYNFRLISVRTGQYKIQSGTEDGFATGP